MKRRVSIFLVALMLISIIGTYKTVPTEVRAYENIKFQDNFEDKTINTWRIIEGSWSVENNKYVISQAGSGLKTVVDSVNISDGTVEADISILDKGQGGLIVRGSNYGTGVDNMSGYYVCIDPTADKVQLHKLGKQNPTDSQNTYLGLIREKSYTLENNKEYHVKVELKGSSIKVYVDNNLVLDAQDSTFTHGSIGLRNHWSTGTYDNVKVTKPAPPGIDSIVSSITSIPIPKNYFTALKLPTVPEGYSIKIKSVEPKNIVSLDTSITFPDVATDVHLVFNVLNQVTNETADTTPITVNIPAKGINFDNNIFVINQVGSSLSKDSYIMANTLIVPDASNINEGKAEVGFQLIKKDKILYSVKSEKNITTPSAMKVYFSVPNRDNDSNDVSIKVNIKGKKAQNSNADLAKEVVLGKSIPKPQIEFETKLESMTKTGSFIKNSDGIITRGENTSNFYDTEWKVVQGLAGSEFASIKSTRYEGQYLAGSPQDAETLILTSNVSTDKEKANATFIITAGLGDKTKLSFQSLSQPAKYIKAEGDKILLSYISSDADCKEATFTKTGINESVSGMTFTKDANHINPILPAFLADPTIHKFGDKYYIYATVSESDWYDNKLVWESSDLYNWKASKLELKVGDSYGGTYEHKMLWAPSVIQGPDSKYYMYYTVYDENPNNPAGGYENNIVAVADNPIGPFTIKKTITFGYSTKNDNTHGFLGNVTHDPQVFKDDDGKYYLVYGGYNYKGMLEQLKTDDLTTTMPETRTELINGSYDDSKPNTGDFGEGSFIFKDKNRYYLTYSEGGYTDSSYKVRYAYSDNGIKGPYVVPSDNIILKSNEGGDMNSVVGIGTGHHSIIKENGEYYMLYGKLANDRVSSSHRQVAMDLLTIGSDGLLKKVIQSYNADNVTKLHESYNNTIGTYESFNKMNVTASSSLEGTGYNFTKPISAIDMNNATAWIAGGKPKIGENNAEWLKIDLGQEKRITGVKTDFWLAQRYHKYKIEYSSDSKNWATAIDKSSNTIAGTMIDDFTKEIYARYVRLTILESEKYSNESNVPNVGIWEIKLKIK